MISQGAIQGKWSTRLRLEIDENEAGEVQRIFELAVSGYMDKLDGKISDEFWEARSSAWNDEEQQILLALQVLE